MNEDLHADRYLRPDDWWACKNPERPYDYREVYDERCKFCLIKAEADLRSFGDRILFDALDHDQTKYMLSDLAAGRIPATQ